MSMPFTQPPATVIYRVQINSEEWTEYKTPVNSSKFVADKSSLGTRLWSNFATPRVFRRC